MSATNPNTGDSSLKTPSNIESGVDNPVLKSQYSALPIDEVNKLYLEVSKNMVMLMTGYQKATNAYAHHLAASNDERGLLVDPQDFRKASKHLIRCIDTFKTEIKLSGKLKQGISDYLEGKQ